jgi:hypothetical protein
MTDERTISTVAALVRSRIDIEGDVRDANKTSRRIS